MLGYWEWREALERGIAAHHAGMLPVFKETVEELFVAGLVKAVFATETLALGINMPARTVVLEKLSKYNGEGHADLTAGEYTQLTGRAGRRGIDIEGHAVVVWSPGMDPRAVAGLASRRTYPLRSSFRPSYNMAVNLVDRLGRAAARDLLEQSFAQYQANAAVVGLARQVTRNTEAIASHAKAMQCHLGDTASYLALLNDLAAAEKEIARAGASRRRDETARDLGGTAPGRCHRGAHRAAGRAGRHPRPGGGDRRVGPAAGGHRRQLGGTADRPPTSVGRCPALGRLRLGQIHRSPLAEGPPRRRLRAGLVRDHGRPAAGARREPVEEIDLTVLRKAVRAHPVHGCADREEHLQWARRWRRLTVENDALAARVAGETGSLGKALEEIIGLLTERGYLRRDRLTADGKMLARIWSESDLVVAECLRRGHLGRARRRPIWPLWCPAWSSNPAGRIPVRPARRPGRRPPRCWPPPGSGPRSAARERAIGLPPTRDPDAGFAAAVAAWCRGNTLADALAVAVAGGTDLSAGDFVRWCRQVIDLLDQVGGVETGCGRCRRAVGGRFAAPRRGIDGIGVAAPRLRACAGAGTGYQVGPVVSLSLVLPAGRLLTYSRAGQYLRRFAPADRGHGWIMHRRRCRSA